MRASLTLFFLLAAMFLASSMVIGTMVATLTETLQQVLLSLFLKGAGLEVLWRDAAALGAIGAALLGVIGLRLRQRI